MRMPQRTASGLTLVEICLALGIAGFCLIAVFGLLPVGINTNQSAVEQTAAASIATMVAADLQMKKVAPDGEESEADQRNLSPRFGFTIPVAGEPPSAAPQTIYMGEDLSPTGSLGSGPTETSRYRVSVGFTPPEEASSKWTTSARILVTWPAASDNKPESWPSKHIGSFEAVIAFTRDSR
ncbi:MAG: hypothetical protein M3463_12175 [Verrucomicrobiota bacterium]|nr:hypothetical protein [Verrucomicrobiota bacterium]